jgi:predicted GTPase
MLDASQGLVDQDRILAQRIADEGRACVIALNKWDAVQDKDDKSYIKGGWLCCFSRDVMWYRSC